MHVLSNAILGKVPWNINQREEDGARPELVIITNQVAVLAG
jgi:hypothetical protein